MEYMTDDQRLIILNSVIKSKRLVAFWKLSEDPVVDDLMSFSNLRHKKKWMHNNRYHKKFRKHWFRYVPKFIRDEFEMKTMRALIGKRLNCVDLANKLVVVQPLPAGAIPIYDNKIF